MKNTFSVFDTLKSAWQLFLVHKKFYLKTVLIFGGIALVADWMADDKSGRLVDTLLSLISTISSWYGSIILMKASLAVSKNQPIPQDVSTVSWQTLLALFVGSILVGIGSLIGFLLLIVPGIIFAVRTSLTSYVILDGEVKIIPAIKKSMALTKGYFWSFARLFLCICVLAVVSVFPLIGLGFIVLVPVSTLTFSLIYRKLQMGAVEIVSDPVQAPQA